MSAELITPAESAKLEELESRIEASAKLIGGDLSQIRTERLYRFTHETFEDYCKEKWGMGRHYINRQIMAAQIIDNIGAHGHQAPETERQARPLAKLPAEQQPAAWERAQEIAKEESKPVAARHVEAAVLEVMPKEEPETVVVDGVSKEAPKRRTPNYIPSDALDIWNVAKTHLDRILKNDIHREQALNEVIAYCQNRISNKK